MTGQDPAEVRVARSVVSLSLVIRSEVVATRARVPLISICLNLLVITDAKSAKLLSLIGLIRPAKNDKIEIFGKFLAV